MQRKYIDKKRREIVAYNIMRFREEQNLSREELGRYAGVTYRQIGNYENGICEPPASVLYDIAERLNVNLYRLFMDDCEWFEYNL